LKNYQIKITQQLSEVTYIVVEKASGEDLGSLITDLNKKYCPNGWQKFLNSIKTKYKTEV